MVSENWKSADFFEAPTIAPLVDDKIEPLAHIRTVNNPFARTALLHSLRTVNKPVIVSFINAHAFNLARKDPAFANDLYHSDILLRDGIGMALLMRWTGRDAGINMNGTDFIPLIVKAFAGKRVALCGTDSPHLENALPSVDGLGANVVLAMHGFLPAEAYAEKLACANVDLIILGMGMPKQERVATLLARSMTGPVVIVNGGAILDFWADRFPRAPATWQALRLEWLFRLLREPRRLWRRYLLGNAQFLLHAAWLRLASRRQKAQGGR